MSNQSHLVPTTTSLDPFSRLTRHGKEVARLAATTELTTMEVNAAAVIEHVRLGAIDAVASRAMQGVAMVTQLEQQLTQTVPLAASRLQALGDMHALAVANEVASLSRRLG